MADFRLLIFVTGNQEISSVPTHLIKQLAQEIQYRTTYELAQGFFYGFVGKQIDDLFKVLGCPHLAILREDIPFTLDELERDRHEAQLGTAEIGLIVIRQGYWEGSDSPSIHFSDIEMDDPVDITKMEPSTKRRVPPVDVTDLGPGI